MLNFFVNVPQCRFCKTEISCRKCFFYGFFLLLEIVVLHEFQQQSDKQHLLKSFPFQAFALILFYIIIHLFKFDYEQQARVCVCVCVCVCLRQFTVKASSAWISWGTREQTNDVILKTLISYAKPFHPNFRMQHLTFLTSHFILLAHQKRTKPRLNQCTSRFQNMGLSSSIKQVSSLVRATSKANLLSRQHLPEASQSN